MKQQTIFDLDKFNIAELDQFTETISKYTLEAREFEDYVLVDKPDKKTTEYKEETQEFKYTYKPRDPNSEEEPIIPDNPEEEPKEKSKGLIPIIVIIVGGLFGGIGAFFTRKKHKKV